MSASHYSLIAEDPKTPAVSTAPERVEYDTAVRVFYRPIHEDIAPIVGKGKPE